ncbi:mucolipin-3 [Silurus meridionalis]|uniref:mucolipin-3 n=1 Tax=Silurus meridionalis TaxID=175797 RepID=UPI001EECF21C|nr:mucolipin-3 [Silurus meridionalis]
MEGEGQVTELEMQFVIQPCPGQSSDMDDSGSSYLAFNDFNSNGGSLWAESLAQQERQEVESFRRKLKYFFMNPCEKYRARSRKPWKLMLQIIKIAVITIQLVSFGLSNQMVVTFKEENLMTFKHLFLKDYENHNAKAYAVYTQNEVYTHLSYIVQQFLRLQNITVGNHAYEKDGHHMIHFLYINTSTVVLMTIYLFIYFYPECLEIYPNAPPQSTAQDTHLSNFTLQFKRLLEVNVYFTLKAINLQTVQHHELPDCYDFSIMITFNNRAHSGRIRVDLDNDVDINECRDWKVTGASPKNIYYTVLFDVVIILTCLASLILCTRSVSTGVQLQFEYTTFFLKHYGKQVCWSDRMEFINGWYILIIISDVLTITGSVLKIAIQVKALTSYDICSILLGTGTMLVWIGVLRYMGYFKKYNILIITLRAAFPNVIRFSCCAAMIYLGYCFCGWIVLGPYHEKFRSLNTVSECLFSLINGDDMFATFKNMQQKSYLVWLFSRGYLYTFVSLFIYMVLSLFITLITDTYETIKQQQSDGNPVSELQTFISECKDHPNSGCYRVEERPSPCFFCCTRRVSDLHERLQC